MSLFDDSIPADVEAVKNGASRIRDLKTLLNSILGIYLNDDKTFKNDVVPGAALVDGSVTTAKLDSGVFPVLQVPVGAMLDYAGTVAPANYLLCQGQAVSRPISAGGSVDTYSALWAVTGTTYGPGDGTTTFNVPDYRGRTSVMPDGGASRAPTISALGSHDGEATHLLTSAESGVPAHTHDMPNSWVKDSGGSQSLGSSGVQGNGGPVTGGVTGGGASAASAHNNLQPSLGANKIIRYA